MGGCDGRAGSGRHVIARSALLAVALTALAVDTSRAAQAAPQEVDAELLEFLGSLDVEEDGWQEYLEQRPVKAAAKVPEKAPPSARAPAPKQVKDK